MLDSKFKGNLTELLCLAAFTELGYQISIPYGDHARYDFIADINNNLYRIQCKSSAISSDESFIRFKCHMTNIRNNETKFYNSNDVDYFYTFYKDKSYLIPVSVGGKQEKILRFYSAQHHSTINWAKDYELETMLTKLGYDYKDKEWSRTITKG